MLKITLLKTIAFLAVILLLGLLTPGQGIIPVKNATAKDWNKKSFWYFPWGNSGVHKGVDIFAKQGTPVLASTSGLVIFSGKIAMGGNVIAILGPKWRIHYYAHLKQVDAHIFDWTSVGGEIGTVGNTGNAIGKPAHLHYSVLSLIPYPWRFSTTTTSQGWKKMFYLDPTESFD